MLATSQSLLERLHDRGDTQAWGRLPNVYEPWLRGWLSRHQLQPADVEDVLQDVLLVVSEKLAVFAHNGRPGAFRTWLRTILTQRVRHFLRGQRNRLAVLSPQPLMDWLAQFEDAASDLSRQWDLEHDQQLARRLLASIREEINPTIWQVFQMLVLEDRPVAEVARHFGLTANAVYIARSRVMARLREEARGLMDV